MMVLAELEGHYKPGRPRPERLKIVTDRAIHFTLGKRSRGASPMNIEIHDTALMGRL
jgi:hypothetical protein